MPLGWVLTECWAVHVTWVDAEDECTDAEHVQQDLKHVEHPLRPTFTKQVYCQMTKCAGNITDISSDFPLFFCLHPDPFCTLRIPIRCRVSLHNHCTASPFSLVESLEQTLPSPSLTLAA